jgi:NAD(P)H-dependent nitrite reductase small subunit
MTSAAIAWSPVCRLADIIPDSGVAALLDGRQIAVFRVRDASGEHLFALDNRDPATGSMVLARGLVGDKAGTLFVASPLLKQRYDLRTGACLDDAALQVATYGVRLHGDQVEIAA